MDNENNDTSGNNIRQYSSDSNINGAQRFQINRLDSVQVGCHRPSLKKRPPRIGESPSPRSSSVFGIAGGGSGENNNSKASGGQDSELPGCSSSLAYQQQDIESIHRCSPTEEPATSDQYRRKSSVKSIRFSKKVSTDSTGSMEQPVRKKSFMQNFRRKSSVFLPDIEEVQNANTCNAYGKSFYNYTHDALPRMDNYRNLMSIQAAQRPTLDDLHDQVHKEYKKPKSGEQVELGASSNKFGWITGVLVRCLLNIWGVMLFLRLSWMVAQSGIIQSMIIIVISTVVTTLTTLSMSAVSTNGDMKGGGIYYMISRSLGAEWGGAIGVIFSFANAAMAALNTVGFSESVIALMNNYQATITGSVINDNRIISIIAILVLQGIIVVGKSWEAKCQSILLVILLIAMGDFVIGAFVGPMGDLSVAKGWVGLNGTVFLENMGPGYRFSEGSEQNFFTVFSIFFPAVAGIQAGASISGDLKDPATAIPKGTLLAIFLTSASYALFALLAGAGVLRDASGIIPTANASIVDCANTTCKWGLYNDYQVMNLMSLFGPIIYAGCFAATLSSALSCLVSGSEMFQALCQDKIYPYMSIFGKGYGKSNDPYWSYAIGFLVAIIFILVGDLNAIAPLISNFFMVTYALLNFCVFHASLLQPLGWRPTFKYYNCWLSLLGAILCIAVMFLMSWVTALISLGCCVALYVIVLYRKPDVNWGATTQAHTYNDALRAIQTLSSEEQHVKNYRPQILVLTGYPSSRPTLVDFAHLLTKKSSLLICANISRTRQPARYRRAILENGYDWLHSRKTKAFYVLVDNCELDEGAQSLIQSTGLGKLAPNILLMGYKANWQTCPKDEVKEYFNVLHEALDNYMAISILRIKDGFDMSHLLSGMDIVMEKSDLEKTPVHHTSSTASLELGKDNNVEYDATDPDGNTTGKTPTSPQSSVFPLDSPGSPGAAKKKGNKLVFGKKNKNKAADDEGVIGTYKGPDGSDVPKDIIQSLSLFSSKQGRGTIDVWWLYDDGGLTLLLPYIISTRKNWSSCKLRVFALANKKAEIEVEQRSMASLLSKFRIDYSDLTVIPDITKKADVKTKSFFNTLIKDFKGDPDEDCENVETIITESELLALNEKTNRHLRLRELLLEHSMSSNLIVMTLPVPRKGTVSAPLYMAWLECLTKDMPPFLLVRGNQSSVLTFYS